MPYKTKHIEKSADVGLLYQCSWIIDKTVRFRELTICENADVRAPEGKLITLIVNGAVLDVKPGKYCGEVVLRVSEPFAAPLGGLMRFNQIEAVMNPAICVEDGKLMPEKSVQEAVHFGSVNDGETDGVLLTASGSFNGVVVRDSSYTVKNSQMDLEGFGCNDFIGSDSAVAVYGDSDVVLDNCEFNLSGVTRCAVHVCGDSKVLVKNSRIENVSPPSDWLGEFCWNLPFCGTNRLCQTADNAKVVYDNCVLRTNGWGIVSVDGVDEGVELTFKDCKMEGFGPRAFTYGSFCIGPCTLNFDHTEVKLHGYPIICMADPDQGFVNVTNGSRILGRCFGFICISDKGSQVLFKDSYMETQLANFVFRGSRTQLTLENMELRSATKRFIQLMDDTDATMGAIKFFVPVGVEDVYTPEHDLFSFDPAEDVSFVIRDTDVVGDAYNSTTNIRAYRKSLHAGMGRFNDTLVGRMDFNAPPDAAPDGDAPGAGSMPDMDPDAGHGPKNLVLTFEKASLTGVISSAKQSYREGVTEIEPDNRFENSMVTQTAAPTVNNGVLVELDAESRWTVTGTSYLTKLVLAEGARLVSDDGSALRMTVDGVETPIRAGRYTGRIAIAKA